MRYNPIVALRDLQTITSSESLELTIDQQQGGGPTIHMELNETDIL